MESTVVARARDMKALIQGLRDETETNRRLPGPIVKELVDSRLCRMSLTEELGGLALPRVEALETYELLAGFEASVPWLVWNNSLVCFFSRYMSPAARTELFERPDWIYAQSTRPCGKASVEKDGYRVNGRWDLVSGCDLADWLMMFCLEEENGELRTMESGDPYTRFVFVPKGQFETVDTWHSGGLRGTGSNDVVIEDLFVPREHTISLGDPVTIDHPLGKIPIVCNVNAEFAAQTLGVAQMAVDTIIEMGTTNVTPGPMLDMRDRAVAQSAAAAHTAALGAARMYLHDRVGEMWNKAESGELASLEDIGEVHGAGWNAVTVARSAVDQMYALAGTRALYTSSPLERAHRDLHAMLRHISAQSLWIEDAGRVSFGLQPVGPLYSI